MAKTTIKTYGEMSGMMEWHPIIHAGRTKFQPTFAGGGNSAFGISPAKYTTDDPFRQFIIEQSDFFKKGRIEILYASEQGEDETSEEADEEDEEAEWVATELKPMEFAATSDAANYLHETFNVAKTRLRSRDSIVNVGKENGIAITFTD